MCAGYGRSVDVIGPNAAKIGARGRKSMAGGPISWLCRRARAPMAYESHKIAGDPAASAASSPATQVRASEHRARFRAEWIRVDPLDKACANADSHGQSANQPPKNVRHGASAPSPRLRGAT